MITGIDPRDFSLYSDLYKDVFGFRPRGDLPFSTAAEFCAEINRLSAMNVEIMTQEEQQAESRAEKFELEIEATILIGAGDRTTALRWLLDAEDADPTTPDIDAYVYHYGLPEEYVGRICADLGIPHWAY